MELLALAFILTGSVCFMIGLSNKTKRVKKGEKTTIGKVEDFGLIENNKPFAYKYKAIIKSGLKKYEIEAYSMPWLEKGEDVSFQMTGHQRVLGNDRLNNRSKVQLFLGIVLIIFPFVMFLAK